MTRWSMARQLVANDGVYRRLQVAQDDFTQAFCASYHTVVMPNRPPWINFGHPLDALSKRLSGAGHRCGARFG